MGNLISRRFHLGEDTYHTVSEAETVGTILALDIVKLFPRSRDVTILLDNQGVIRASQNYLDHRPGQYLLRAFEEQAKKLFKYRKRLQIRLVWVPGHKDVKMN